MRTSWTGGPSAQGDAKHRGAQRGLSPGRRAVQKHIWPVHSSARPSPNASRGLSHLRHWTRRPPVRDLRLVHPLLPLLRSYRGPYGKLNCRPHSCQQSSSNHPKLWPNPAARRRETESHSSPVALHPVMATATKVLHSLLLMRHHQCLPLCCRRKRRPIRRRPWPRWPQHVRPRRPRRSLRKQCALAEPVLATYARRRHRRAE